MVRILPNANDGIGLSLTTDSGSTFSPGAGGFIPQIEIRAMDTTPINHIGQRLKELDQQIHTCLRDVRRNLAELEKVSDKETGVSGDSSGGKFADMLKSSISRRQDTPPSS